jgi:RNA polymerase sigma factor (sigma-70 family)
MSADASDWQLLQDYAKSGSEPAFTILVRRHVDMVYAASLRQLRDPHLAEDATQAVFILLARKASSLRSSVVVAGWLYRTTSHVASRALRDRIRQQRRETEAAAMNFNEPAEELWEKLAPHLDGALHSLSTSDRDAVVLRFLEHRSFRNVAEVLGVSEDAAKKRVNRALEKLRGILHTHGVTISTVALSPLLLANSAPAAPASAITAAAVAAGGTKGATGALTLAAEIARDWWLAKLKWSGATLGLASLILWWIANSGFQQKPAGSDNESARTNLKTGETNFLTEVGSGETAAVTPASTHIMRIKIVSAANGLPLAGATMEVTYYGAKYLNSKAVSDANGFAEITRPNRRYEGMTFWIAAPGHVPKCLSWKREEEFSLPSEYIVKLAVGAQVSGRVANEEGQPVSGATLRFNGEGMKWNSRDYTSYGHLPTRPISDVNGIWTVDFLDPKPTASGYVKHPDYAETEFKFELAAAQATNATLILKRGAPVSGVTEQPDGTPIPNVTVTADWEYSTREAISGRSDTHGRFSLPHVTTGRFRLKASAEGYQPLETWVELSSEGLNLALTLTPKKIAGKSILRGRVVDDAGNPVPGIHVSLNQDQPTLKDVDWSTTSDDDGSFIWNQAPEGKVRLRFSSWYYEQLTSVELVADGAEQVVTMKAIKTSRVHCLVTDQKNGQMVSLFKVMTGKRHTLPGGKDTDELNFIGEGRDGQFTFRWRPENLNSTSPWKESAILRVEANGFMSETVPLTDALDGDAVIRVELEPSDDLQSVVFSPRGIPARGAQVALMGTRLDVSMQQPGRLLFLDNDSRSYGTTTSDDGSFRLPRRKEGEQLVIVHDEGWAKVTLNEFNGDSIELRPWGRIEGMLYVGHTPASNQQVVASSGFQTGETIPFYYTTRTDAAGRFVFNKVPPGLAALGRYMVTPFSQNGSGFTATSQQKELPIVSGQTTSVTLGGTGVPVKGRLLMDSPRTDVAFELPAQHLRPAHLKPDPVKPMIGHGFFCRPDGTFVVEDIPPGSYVLQLQLRAIKDRNNPEASLSGFQVGERKIEVTIPADNSAEVNLGDIVIPVRQDSLPHGVR